MTGRDSDFCQGLHETQLVHSNWVIFRVCQMDTYRNRAQYGESHEQQCHQGWKQWVLSASHAQSTKEEQVRQTEAALPSIPNKWKVDLKGSV